MLWQNRDRSDVLCSRRNGSSHRGAVPPGCASERRGVLTSRLQRQHILSELYLFNVSTTAGTEVVRLEKWVAGEWKTAGFLTVTRRGGMTVANAIECIWL